MRDRPLREWRALVRERADRDWRELSPEQRARACELILEKCQELNELIRAFLEAREPEVEPMAVVEPRPVVEQTA